MPHAACRLTALTGTPLADPATRRTVIAAARALAERQGIEIVDLSADDRSILVTLDAEEVTAVGFASELRRITEAWYRTHHRRTSDPPPTLWGRPDDPPGQDSQDEIPPDMPWTGPAD